MFTSHDWRGRHRQAARNLSIAVTSAVLAGGAAAMAADGGTPAPTKPAGDDAHCVKPAPRDERAPLSADDPIVEQARTGLQGLVTAGTIEQAEADAILRGVISGSVAMGELVDSGTVAADHVAPINAVLRAVKEGAIAAGGGDAKPAPAGAIAAKRARAAADRRARAARGA
jgi:hypothetical protein